MTRVPRTIYPPSQAPYPLVGTQAEDDPAECRDSDGLKRLREQVDAMDKKLDAIIGHMESMELKLTTARMKGH